MNSFIACEHNLCEINQMTAFTICQKCEKVSEVMDEELSDYLNTSIFSHDDLSNMMGWWLGARN